jgi:hypothetical protein
MDGEKITLYIAETGDDSNEGTREKPLWSVAAALSRVRNGPGKLACFIISGSVTEVAAVKGMIDITGEGLPMILLRGESPERPGVLNARGLEKRVIYIADDNTLCIEDHIVICGGSTQGIGGAGISVEGGTLIMKGGEISDNDAGFGLGGGVYVGKNSKFAMMGGKITRNKTKMHGGGVFPDEGGKFSLFNGTISDNLAFVSGGGVFVGEYAEFSMFGGCIEKNMAGGERTMLIGGISIPCGQGGGVYVCRDSRFNMEDGKIIKNRAVAVERDDHAGSGGGVFVEEGGICGIKQGNIARNGVMNWGGGVYTEGRVTIIAECIIENNVARLGGGGVCIARKRGLCEMKGGFLLNNYTGGKGGAVHVMKDASFILEHGIITKNCAHELGHAFAISGNAAINGGLTFRNIAFTKEEAAQIPVAETLEAKKPGGEDTVPVIVLEDGGKLVIRGGEIEGKIALKNKNQLEDLREVKNTKMEGEGEA